LQKQYHTKITVITIDDDVQCSYTFPSQFTIIPRYKHLSLEKEFSISIVCFNQYGQYFSSQSTASFIVS